MTTHSKAVGQQEPQEEQEPNGDLTKEEYQELEETLTSFTEDERAEREELQELKEAREKIARDVQLCSVHFSHFRMRAKRLAA
jgi:hypothetical protein